MTTSTPSSKKRKPRAKKYASELSTKTARNVRRALVNEIAQHAAAEFDRARSELANAERREKNIERVRRTNMLSKGLVPRLRAAMNSWGIDLPISMHADSTISASTDFKSITVHHDRRLTRGLKDDEEMEPVSVEELRQIAAETRGLFYHEVGHNLFSVQLSDLLTEAWKNGYVVPEDCARISERHVDPVTASEVPTRWATSSTFRTAWNCLEDQRMETALVEESPQIAAYLTIMALRHIVHGDSPTAWALAAGRFFLPEQVRVAAKSMWSLSGSPVDADTVEQVVLRYITADDAVTMVQCCLSMLSILDRMNPNATGHDHWEKVPTGEAKERIQNAAQKTQQAVAQRSNSDSPHQTTADAPGKKNDTESDSDESETPANDAAGNAEDGVTDPGENPSHGKNGAGSDSSEEVMPRWAAENQIRDSLSEALDALDEDENLDDDVAAINDAYASDDGALPMWKHVKTSTNEEVASKALSIVDDIERAFMLATEDCAPRWESGQRRGVLDVMRYSSRQPGDVEIFRNYSDSGDPAADLDVTLFLDISGSMDGTGDDLGAAAWAVKTACDRLGIGCDVALFNEGGYQLWGIEDRPYEIPTIGSAGGTNPSQAFDALLFEERSKKTHLVMVMTDGAWSNGVVMNPWKKSNTHSVLFYYGYGAAGAVPSLAMSRGADEAFAINDLMDIPVTLENILSSIA